MRFEEKLNYSRSCRFVPGAPPDCHRRRPSQGLMGLWQSHKHPSSTSRTVWCEMVCIFIPFHTITPLRAWWGLNPPPHQRYIRVAQSNYQGRTLSILSMYSLTRVRYSVTNALRSDEWPVRYGCSSSNHAYLDRILLDNITVPVVSKPSYIKVGDFSILQRINSTDTAILLEIRGNLMRKLCLGRSYS